MRDTRHNTKVRRRVKAARTYPSATRYDLLDENGTTVVSNARGFTYNVGNCAGASVTLPHMRGDRPDVCSDCWIVTPRAELGNGFARLALVEAHVRR